MVETDLSTVAERIVRENRSANTVKKVNEAGPHDTYVDIEASPFGVEWGDANLGEWSPIAVEHKPDAGAYVYRIWFQTA